jgi:hypothetical protein
LSYEQAKATVTTATTATTTTATTTAATTAMAKRPCAVRLSFASAELVSRGS